MTGGSSCKPPPSTLTGTKGQTNKGQPKCFGCPLFIFLKNHGFGPRFYPFHFASAFRAFLSFSVLKIRVIFPFAGLPYR